MLLASDKFDEIGHVLRNNSGGKRQRQLQVDVTLATASGDLIDARIHHFSRGGIGLITATPLQQGTRFGFKIPEISGAHFLFCEVLNCRLNAEAFAVNGSFLAHEMPSSHDRLKLMTFPDAKHLN